MLTFDKKKVVGTAVIKKPITEEDVETIIVTSFEGGSNYWMGLDVQNEDMQAKPKGEPWSTWSAKLLIDGKSIKLYDIEDEEDDSQWILTLEKLIKGYQLNCENRPHDCDLDQGDATTSDCIVQFSLFGQVVYG
ncbi:hypothetical protein BSK59_15730 [Paenibacillus odorifer]|uniref:hypothetical protein n=1 Tax=Paenibacillus odorifer TaxID=189426 RepID=UPI00096C236F|nr:hypothetical protein [Paenibacillus odorifer]OME54030.1 hypothetical protein BSK59_15730 [Paenibacillus odorifer]